MAIEVTPVGVKCNIQCQYCYQNPMRDAGAIPHGYDLEKIKVVLAEARQPFSLFGGEPLLMRRADLEDLWAWGYARYGRNFVQTNGTLIDDDIIRMFRRYNVRVGMSLDGPGELNDARWGGSLKATRRSTEKAQAALLRLCQEGMTPSVIVTLTRVNAAPNRIDRLSDWLRSLDRLGIKQVRLHVLESETETIRSHYGLTAQENTDALLKLAGLEENLEQLRFDLFADMTNMLLGQDQRSTCIWTGCDPYTTRAVSGVSAQGEPSNCSRTNKDGIDYIKSDRSGYERYLALYLTPQEFGGCQGCRFFLMCKGQCPGTGLSGDWRNRSEHCETWKALFAHLEEGLISRQATPLSVSHVRQELEERMMAGWAGGENLSITQTLRACGQLARS